MNERIEELQVEQEPLMITPGGGAFPFAVVGEIEPAEQEPVGFGVMAFGELQQSSVHYEAMLEAAKAKQDSGLWDDVEVVELYTHPVRTKDLTDDEIHKCDRATVTRQDFARAVIAAFKEKNK